MSLRQNFTHYIHYLQNTICQGLEDIDGKATFKEDAWQRPGGGGGKTRVIRGGNVFEKGGVNVSTVHGKLNEALKKQLNVDHDEFFACGLSLVIHPVNPMVPTTHANFRFFELYDAHGKPQDSWFGGGMDLTPYYLWKEDAIHFHQTIKNTSDEYGKDLFPIFKEACDIYFYNAHRKEARGIGGNFFDYLREGKHGRTTQDWYDFTTAMGETFLEAYLPIVKRRMHEPYGEKEKIWQEIRRGRYVEFNLIHDKGTLFGLRSDGRIESILMSLPATVRWEYNHEPEAGSREEELLKYLVPIDWVGYEMAEEIR